MICINCGSYFTATGLESCHEVSCCSIKCVEQYADEIEGDRLVTFLANCLYDEVFVENPVIRERIEAYKNVVGERLVDMIFDGAEVCIEF